MKHVINLSVTALLLACSVHADYDGFKACMEIASQEKCSSSNPCDNIFMIFDCAVNN
ncbi:hypothetical protein GQ54DRAFT_297391 [Martensiomyces pterosporus]|nr:hypothetical protein GQ54DRAFT_297391 [Martensiomyces pterosporus]